MTDAAAARFPCWPRLARRAWILAIGSSAIVLMALVWHDGLGPVPDGLLLLHYVAFMCQTFAYHAGLAMIPVVVLALLARRHRLLLASGAALLLGVGPELMSLWPRTHAERPGEVIKLMSINLMYGHGDTGALLAQIAKEAPDVLVFQEWTPEGGAALRGTLAAAYPHSFEQPRDDAFGQAVFSRRPFVSEPHPYPPLHGFFEPQIYFGVMVDGHPMRVTDVHLLPPGGLTYFREQRATAARIAGWMGDRARNDRSDILMGDFNAPPRTGILAAMRRAGLVDAQAAGGWWRGSTWPRGGVLRWAPGLQLDHVLMRDTVECIEARTGDECGSDHRPVIVRVRWR